MIVASEAPHDVLALGGIPRRSGTIRPASWNPPAHSPAEVVPADYRPNAAPGDDSEHYNQPYVVVSPRPATPAQASAVPSAVTAATATASATRAPNQTAPSQQEAADFQVTNLSAYLCSTPTCQDTFEVKNVGGQAAAATLYVADPSVGERSFPLGTLAPGDTRQVSFSRQNIAPEGGTVTFHGRAWVYSSALYGPDPTVAQRLRARGLEPDKLSEVRGVGMELRPTAVTLLDQMTKDTLPADQGTINAKALEALRSATDQGQLPILAKIIDSGRLQNPGDLHKIIPAAVQIGDRRGIEQVAHLLRIDPTAKVWYDGPYIVDGKQYQADYIYTGTENGQPVQRAVQVKTVSVLKNLGTLMGYGAEQLNGEKPGPGRNGIPEQAPPGFERVLLIYLEPTTGPRIFLDTQHELEDYILSRRLAQARQNLCKPNGEPRIDRLVIVNGTGIHQWTDLRKIGVPC